MTEPVELPNRRFVAWRFVAWRHPVTGRFMAGDCEQDCLEHCADLCGANPKENP